MNSVVSSGRRPRYANLQIDADGFLRLQDDGFRYELIGGVVVMSPSPTPRHQKVLLEILFQLESHVRKNRVGEVFAETDVRFDDSLVYRPDLIYVRSEKVRRPLERIDVVPDLVVEVVSPGSEADDLRTKREAYERFGVGEYWIIEPNKQSFRFLQLTEGRYRETTTAGDVFESSAVSGFVLDLVALRAACRAL